MKGKTHDLNHDFSAHTINCVCHSIRSMFRVLGMYNFGARCDLHESQCDFFATSETKCYFGSYSQTDGETVVDSDNVNPIKTYHKSGMILSLLNSLNDEKIQSGAQVATKYWVGNQ